MITISKDIITVSIKGNLPQELKTHLAHVWGFLVPFHTVWSIDQMIKEMLAHSTNIKTKALVHEIRKYTE